MYQSYDEIDLSGEAGRSTIGTAAAWLGWALLLGLALVTAVHAVSITRTYTGLNTATGDAFAIVRIAGVVLAELFAVATAIMLATHTLRAKQKPMAMAVEVTWVAFAAVNLISSFAVEHGGDLPAFVGTWVRYGLPIAALVIGVEFYIMLRLNPDAKRADDMAELTEKFAHNQHLAAVSVLNSEQMKAVQRQAAWQKLPSIIGQQLNLSDEQILALERQAPALLDLNRNGASRPAADDRTQHEYGSVTNPDLRTLIDRGDLHVPPAAAETAAATSPNGRGPAENGRH